MKKLNLMTLLLGAGLFMAMGTTTLSAKCGDSVKAPAAKCGAEKKAAAKCGAEKKAAAKCGAEKKEAPKKAAKCGVGKCG